MRERAFEINPGSTSGGVIGANVAHKKRRIIGATAAVIGMTGEIRPAVREATAIRTTWPSAWAFTKLVLGRMQDDPDDRPLTIVNAGMASEMAETGRTKRHADAERDS